MLERISIFKCLSITISKYIIIMLILKYKYLYNFVVHALLKFKIYILERKSAISLKWMLYNCIVFNIYLWKCKSWVLGQYINYLRQFPNSKTTSIKKSYLFLHLVKLPMQLLISVISVVCKSVTCTQVKN